MWAPPLLGRDRDDAVVEDSAAGLQHAGDLARVLVDLRLADVLDHADAGDRIEAFLAQVAVIHHPELDPVVHSGLARQLLRQLRLRLRERDAPDRGAVLARGVDRQASPAAADVEHALAGLQLELAADQLQLGALGVLQGLRPWLEQRTAVGHRLVQEQGEELVRDVVVVADGLRVAALRVPAPPARAKLGGGRLRPAMEARGPQRRRSESQSLREAERGRVPAAEQRDHPVQVVDIDFPANVGATEPELAGGAQNVTDGARGTNRQGRAVARRRNARPVPELDREGTIRKRALDAATQSVGACPGHAASLAQTSVDAQTKNKTPRTLRGASGYREERYMCCVFGG